MFWNITCPYTVFINFYNVVLYFSSFQFFNISLTMTTAKEFSATFFGFFRPVNSPISEWERTLSLITTSSGSIPGFIIALSGSLINIFLRFIDCNGLVTSETGTSSSAGMPTVCSRSYCLRSLSGCCPIKSRCLFCHSLSFSVYFFWFSCQVNCCSGDVFILVIRSTCC